VLLGSPLGADDTDGLREGSLDGAVDKDGTKDNDGALDTEGALDIEGTLDTEGDPLGIDDGCEDSDG